ncbi:hypothetical protein ACFFGR_04850 [Arthrobacter liuii]|uniref:Uncharacterized protein n=1 Tax=Arthrobacter liuii TaxID=1476996 RepID=A0ABQ2ALU4_9MICC|nr:hypothetical protein [Arthrobacter liuii]GGH92014.1 hypothetical protein GCM10007170_09570 [Arthrobacter liuii]
MRILRIAVLAADILSLLALLLIHFVLPLNSGQDGEALFWAGLLLTYALILLFGMTLVVNVVYLIALAFMHGRYDNGYSHFSRILLFLLPATTIVVLTVR